MSYTWITVDSTASRDTCLAASPSVINSDIYMLNISSIDAAAEPLGDPASESRSSRLLRRSHTRCQGFSYLGQSSLTCDEARGIAVSWNAEHVRILGFIAQCERTKIQPIASVSTMASAASSSSSNRSGQVRGREVSFKRNETWQLVSVKLTIAKLRIYLGHFTFLPLAMQSFESNRWQKSESPPTTQLQSYSTWFVFKVKH